ncbi:MAG TPA: 2-oxo-4-hydroxy-4-carboxy-5-ureidoimidazoline decarboxylase [Jatrophihabitantaceae bacterium]
MLTDTALRQCCAADAWVDAIVAGRPYPDEDALGAASDKATLDLDDTGLAQALAGHPRIGERVHGGWSSQEQSGVSGAGGDVRAQLAAANAEYEQRFGHVYLVCATGKSADEMLAICRARLANDPDTEEGVVRDELAKINRLRLAKLVHEQ